MIVGQFARIIGQMFFFQDQPRERERENERERGREGEREDLPFLLLILLVPVAPGVLEVPVNLFQHLISVYTAL